MIINTGMRTDIPAFYSEWFARRIKSLFQGTREKQIEHMTGKPVNES